MPNGLIPKNFWTLPQVRMPSLWQDLIEETRLDTIPSGLSISEDEKYYYVDAALPGIDPKDIEVTFERGVLHISGQSKEEIRDRKVYRKATSSFSYSIASPAEIDAKKEPKVSLKNGMVHAVFTKMAQPEPKKIEVKVEP